MRIICDMDEVLADMMTPLLEQYNEKYEADIVIDDIVQWELPQDMIEVFKFPAFFLNLLPIPGAMDGIAWLVKWGHDVVIATNHSDSDYVAADKVLWVKEWFGSLSHNMMIGARKDLLQGDMIIDDNPEYLISSPCPIKICMDRPWNRDFSLYNGKVSYRVYHWGQILEVFQLGGDNRLW